MFSFVVIRVALNLARQGARSGSGSSGINVVRTTFDSSVPCNSGLWDPQSRHTASGRGRHDGVGSISITMASSVGEHHDKMEMANMSIAMR